MWDGLADNSGSCNSGVYFCTMNTGVFKKTMKMLLLR